jgi:hypothetical protein
MHEQNKKVFSLPTPMTQTKPLSQSVVLGLSQVRHGNYDHTQMDLLDIPQRLLTML